MKPGIILLILFTSGNAFSQRGFSFGFDFGKSVSLNSLLYNDKELAYRTHLYNYLNPYDQQEYTVRFPNIYNWGVVAEYRGKRKSFWSFKYSHTTNWLMFSQKPSTFELLFPSASRKKYSQAISYYSLSRNRQIIRKKGFFSFGIGVHVSIYNWDIDGKEIYNNQKQDQVTSVRLTPSDSIVSISESAIWMYYLPFGTPVGININFAYSHQFRKAGRISFFTHAYLNLTPSYLGFEVFNEASSYYRSTGITKFRYNTNSMFFWVVNNPLQFGIIYYFPPLKLNRNIVRKE